MAHQIVKHTADIRLLIEAGTKEKLFQEALASLMELLYQNIQSLPETVEKEIELTAPDQTALLVDFLSDILTLSHTNKEIYSRVEIKSLIETKITAKLYGGKVDHLDEDVKAVTYHEADIKKNEKGLWETTLVLDV